MANNNHQAASSSSQSSGGGGLPSSLQAQQQQMSSISNIVRQCCEDEAQFRELSMQIVVFVKSNQQSKEAAKPVVDTIKQIIKDRKQDSPQKFLSLMLLHKCVMEGGGQSEEFIIYMEKKIMSRLAILARHKKDSNDLEKGSQLFGKGANPKASADFLKLLLLYIQAWAARFPMYTSAAGKQTEIAKIYQSLVKEKVHFPSEQSVMDSLCTDYSTQSINDTQHSNANSTAPQSLNHSQVVATPQVQIQMSRSLRGAALASMQQPQQELNQSSMTAGGRREKSLESKLRKSMNASVIVSKTPAQEPLALSKEEQIQIANQIKADYKKLNEYSSTAKLVQEVIDMQGDTNNSSSLSSIDDELLIQFRDQLLEGKEFSEKFLRTIIETPFTIRDRDSKIEKIIGIIGEIDGLLNRILKQKPLPMKTGKDEETKRGEKFGNPTPGSNVAKQSVSNALELKGILKISKQASSQSSAQPQPSLSARGARDKAGAMNSAENPNSLFGDFKFDQNAFKTNFVFNSNNLNQSAQNGIDTNFFDSNWPSQNQSSLDNPNQQAPTNSNFLDMTAFNHDKKEPNPFDFGFGNQQNQNVAPATTEEFKWESNEVAQEEEKKIQEPSLSTSSEKKIIGKQPSLTSRRSPVQLIGGKNRSSFKSSERSDMKVEDKFGITKNIVSHQPQITQRDGSDDSNPMYSDDGGHLSSSNENTEINMPIQMKDNQKLRQSIMGGNQSRQVQVQPNVSDFDFNWVAPQEKTQEKTGQTKEVQEKFDFSDIQNTDRSSKQDSERLQIAQQLNNQLTKERDELRTQLTLSQAQIKGLESNVENLTLEVKRHRHFELLYEDEKYSKIQLELDLRSSVQKVDEYKKMAERLEHKISKFQKDHESALETIADLEKALEMKQKDMDALHLSESETKRLLQTDLNESRRREEECRAQMMEEATEAKKREDFMKEQWLKDLQDKERSDEVWASRLQELERGISERDAEIESLRRKVSENENQVLKVKKRSIVFNNSKERTQPPPLLQQQEGFDFSFPPAQIEQESKPKISSPPVQLFASVIKPLQQQSDMNLEIQNFEPTQTMENQVMKTPVQVNQQSASNYEETMAYVPSGDSDKESKDADDDDNADVLVTLPQLSNQIPTPQALQVSEKSETSPSKNISNLTHPQPAVPHSNKSIDPFDFPIPQESNKTVSDFDFMFGGSNEVAAAVPVQSEEEDDSIQEIREEVQSEEEEEKQEEEEQDFSRDEDQKVIESDNESEKVLLIQRNTSSEEEEQEENQAYPQTCPLSPSHQASEVDSTVRVSEQISNPVIQETQQQEKKPEELNPFDIFQEEIKAQEPPHLNESSKIEKQEEDHEPVKVIDSSIGENNSPKKQSGNPFEEAIKTPTPVQDSVRHIDTPKNGGASDLDTSIDQSRFSTINTENYKAIQQTQQTALAQANPQIQLQQMLISYFRKSLLSQKAVLYEDPNIQIGIVQDIQQSIVRMRLFFGNKNPIPLQQIGFMPLMKPHGYKVMQSRDRIEVLNNGQQEPVDINMQIETYQLSLPVYNLTYKINDQLVSLPVRLPMILLKLCSAPTSLDSPQDFIQKWQSLSSSSSESLQSFNIDFGMCRSLTQLKDTLKLGRNAFAFVDGVEAQKNIVCGATMFQSSGSSNQQPLIALIKVKMTVDGQNCEIIARSNDSQSGQIQLSTGEDGKFGKFVIGNILELIALPRFAGPSPINK